MKLRLSAFAASMVLLAPVAAQATGLTLVAGPSYGGPAGGGYTPSQIQAPGQFNGGAIAMPSRPAAVPTTPVAPIVRPRR